MILAASLWGCHGAESPATPSPPPSTSASACSTWANNSAPNVTVNGFARFGAAEGCAAVLSNVRITFFALPQSTIVLDGWSMRGGGSVVIQGPPEAPWSIRDVTVIVRNSVIEAVDGPAVSVVLGAGYISGISDRDGVTLRNVSLHCNGSRLSSLAGQAASATASALSVTLSSTLAAASSAVNVTIDRFTVVVMDSDLRSTAFATANSTSMVAGFAVPQYGATGSDLVTLTVSNSVLYVLRCNVTAAATSSSDAI